MGWDGISHVGYRISIVDISTLLKNIDIDMVILENINIDIDMAIELHKTVTLDCVTRDCDCDCDKRVTQKSDTRE